MEKNGSAVSERIKEAMNNKQAKFVIGAENFSLLPTSSVFIDLEVRFKGTYSPF